MLLQLLNYLQAQGFPVVGISADAVNAGDRAIQTTYNNQPIRLDFSETPPTDTTELDAAIAAFVPVIPPDWTGFMDGLAEIDGVYAAISGSAMASIITTRIIRLADGQPWKGDTDPLLQAWNASPPTLDAGQRDSLTQLAEDNSIPISIDADNILSTI